MMVAESDWDQAAAWVLWVHRDYANVCDMLVPGQVGGLVLYPG